MAGGGGSLVAGLYLDLYDNDHDGRVRFNEIAKDYEERPRRPVRR